MHRLLALPLVLLACAAGFAGLGGAASAAQPAPLSAAREALVLTDQRLGLMYEVMASKWFSRAPIQDPAQETSVKEAAVAKAQALGVAAGGTRTLFEAEIATAKEVQLGWGSHWLYYGPPAELAAPELTTLRARLSEISEQIVALLPRLVSLPRVPDAEARVTKMAAKVLRVKYLTTTGRALVVEALLGIRPASGA